MKGFDDFIINMPIYNYANYINSDLYKIPVNVVWDYKKKCIYN